MNEWWHRVAPTKPPWITTRVIKVTDPQMFTILVTNAEYAEYAMCLCVETSFCVQKRNKFVVTDNDCVNMHV